MEASRQNAARLLALDWGTTALRAWLLDEGGDALDHRHARLGVMHVADRDFSGALRGTCGDWLAAHPGLPAIACGMIGSRQGWIEAPYVACPAGFDALASACVAVDAGNGTTLRIVPGLRYEGDAAMPDVMRGEETQVFGAARAGQLAGVYVLPGTHSKWVFYAQGRIQSFRTYMTGELFACLRAHTILGRLMAADAPHAPDAFRRGWEAGLACGDDLLHRLFGVRTLALLDRLTPAEGPGYLSGLLIGAEVRSACGQRPPPRVTLIGDAELCERYREVLEARGSATTLAPADSARIGLHRIARAARLIAP
jgi:2-dehydro-3-deoxygalactonokinase